MCVLVDKVNSLHHRYGAAPKANPGMRALVGADLWSRGFYGIATGTQAALVVGVSRPLIDAAKVVLQSRDQVLLAQVLNGSISLTSAAAQVKPRAELITAFKNAAPTDRVAFAQTVGVGEIFDTAISPLL